MELKEFVKMTIEQILNGVNDVNFQGEYKVGINANNNFIEFEVMLTEQSNKEKEKSIGVFLPNIGLGAKIKDDIKDLTLTKVSFKVPILWQYKNFK
jgi:hypothetical protein